MSVANFDFSPVSGPRRLLHRHCSITGSSMCPFPPPRKRLLHLIASPRKFSRIRRRPDEVSDVFPPTKCWRVRRRCRRMNWFCYVNEKEAASSSRGGLNIVVLFRTQKFTFVSLRETRRNTTVDGLMEVMRIQMEFTL